MNNEIKGIENLYNNIITTYDDNFLKKLKFPIDFWATLMYIVFMGYKSEVIK